jgi:hypothetical protein
LISADRAAGAIRRGLRSCLLCLALALALTPAPAAAEVLVVDAIAVEATGADLAEAREKAFAEGRRLAVEEAMRRSGMAPGEIDAATADRAILYMQVDEERTAADTYAASLRFGIETRFLPGVPGSPADEPAAALPMAWVLVVAASADALGARQFDPAGPWTGRWSGAGGAFQPPMIVVAGDALDRRTLEAGPALGGEEAALQALAARYGAPAAAIATLAGDPRSALSVEVSFWSPATGFARDRPEVAAPPGDPGAALDAAVDAARRSIALMAGLAPGAGTGAEETVVSVFMQVASAADWEDARAAIESVEGARVASAVFSGDRMEAMVLYRGRREDFLQELRGLGLVH